MKKTIIFIFLFLLTSIVVVAQETEGQAVAQEKDKPVRSPFESGYLIDQITSVIKVPKTLEFTIQHKFGTMTNGRSDLWGIYSPGANVRLSLDYVLARNLQAGIGITKKNMYSDFNLKWTVLEQTRKNTIPVSVTLFGNMVIDGRSQDYFDGQRYRHSSDPYSYYRTYTYRPNERLSFFSEIMIGRKFTEWLSIQAGASFSHFNLVGATGDHDKIGAHFSGQVKLSTQGYFIFNGDVPLKIKDISEQKVWIDHPKPNLACGLQISTSAHAFQIYISSSDGILPQEIMVNNQKDWKNKGFAIGFTMTRLWFF